MKKTCLVSALALAFGLSGPVLANDSESDGGPGAAAVAFLLSTAVAVDADSAVNAADQSGAVDGNAFATGLFGGTVTGDNDIVHSFNNVSGINQNAQNTGVQSLVQQNVAVQANAATDNADGAVALAAGGAFALAVDNNEVVNVAAQSGSVSGNLYLAGGAGVAATGDNTVCHSFNANSGIMQNAQNTGIQSAIQQNVAVQVNGL